MKYFILVISFLMIGCSSNTIIKYKQYDAPSTDLLTYTQTLPKYTDAKTAADVTKERGKIEKEWRDKLQRWINYYNKLKEDGVAK